MVCAQGGGGFRLAAVTQRRRAIHGVRDVPDAKTVKNRIHLDVRPYPGGDHLAEAKRLRDCGAVPADVGQGEVPWVVLADPEGGEFCVLTPS